MGEGPLRSTLGRGRQGRGGEGRGGEGRGAPEPEPSRSGSVPASAEPASAEPASAEGQPQAFISHLEWGRVVQSLAEYVVCGAALTKICTDTGEVDADALLPRTTDVPTNRDRLRVLAGLEWTLDVARTLSQRVSVAGELGKVEAIEPLLARAARGSVLDLTELCRIDDAIGAAAQLQGMLDAVAELAEAAGLAEEQRASRRALARALEGLRPPAALVELLPRSLDREGEPSLADDASPALGGLRRRFHEARRALTGAAQKLLRRPSWSTALADNYWTEREGRVVLPVRSDGFSRQGAQGTISGIIHGSSSSGQTLFVEPHALIDENNAVREAATAVRSEELRIMARLSKEIGSAQAELVGCVRALVELDLQQARLRLCQRLQAVAPELVEAAPGATMRLPAARHPLMVLRGTPVVPNDLEVGIGSALVISGPNAGGKTVALKTMGLCVLMATAGLRVPAGTCSADRGLADTGLADRGSERTVVVPLYDAIVTDVGDDQSIAADLSTFSAHVGHVREAFSAAQRFGPSTLVLLDEVAVGTDPEQGSALAEAIVIELVEHGATLVVTTHYERLKLLATADPRFVNASVGFDLEQLRPTFELRIGTPGSSSALAVAQRLGLPEAVLDRARALMAGSRVRLDELLQEVESERARLAQERAELQRTQAQVQAQRARLADEDRRVETSAARRRAQAHQAATSTLRGLEDEIKRRRKAMRGRDIALDASGVTDPAERELARAARTELAALTESSAHSDAPPPGEIQLGDHVEIVGLGARGEVVALRADKVTVQLGAIRSTVSPEELRRVSAAAGTTKKKARPSPAGPPVVTFGSDAARHFGADAAPTELGIDRVLDIRGQRADEAIEAVEVFLDQAIAADREVVVLQHGHGSGALRKAIREHLPRLRHVKKHRPGLPPEGGEAVTVVWVQA